MTSTNSTRPVALITGASAGIGSCFARKLAEKGCDLILVARRQDRLETLAAQLESEFSISAEPLQADLTKDADLDKVYARIKQCERLEYLVNNAGFGTHPLFADSDLDSQSAMARLHMLAVIHLTHAALPGMIACKKGNIITTASLAGFMQSPGNVMYCSTKTWNIAFTKSLAIELAGTGVNAQALCPGFTYSEFHDVMEVDRGLVPKFWWMPKEYVVDYSLSHPNKTVCVPALKYKIALALYRCLPDFLKVYFAKKRAKTMQKTNL